MLQARGGRGGSGWSCVWCKREMGGERGLTVGVVCVYKRKMGGAASWCSHLPHPTPRAPSCHSSAPFNPSRSPPPPPTPPPYAARRATWVSWPTAWPRWGTTWAPPCSRPTGSTPSRSGGEGDAKQQPMLMLSIAQCLGHGHLWLSQYQQCQCPCLSVSVPVTAFITPPMHWHLSAPCHRDCQCLYMPICASPSPLQRYPVGVAVVDGLGPRAPHLHHPLPPHVHPLPRASKHLPLAVLAGEGAGLRMSVAHA